MKVVLSPENQFIINKIYTAARTCYSSDDQEYIFNQSLSMTKEDMLKTITHCLNSGHSSVVEHQQLTFYISGVSRALTHQLVRKRIASYCVAGDTLIRQQCSQKSKTIKELYESPNGYHNLRNLRCVNETTREIEYDKVKSVCYAGIKPVFELKTDFGYTIKATAEHHFLTDTGWRKLKDLSVGDTVYVNGAPAYQDIMWLKHHYVELGESQEEIGVLCGVSKHTIRKWVRKFSLQKPLGSWSIGKEPANKGKNKFTYEPMMKTSKKLLGNHNTPKLYGKDNPAYKGPEAITVSGGYSSTHRSIRRSGVCSNCGRVGVTELHHLDKNPRNTNKNNILELCVSCHKSIHRQEIKEVIIPNKVVSITFVGDAETYDIEMAGNNHNYIANGFVVHNSQMSQRYCKLKPEEQLEYVVPFTIQKSDTTFKIYDDLMNTAKDTYQKLVDAGVPAEDARYVLPNATATNITVSLNIRSLINLAEERLCVCSQWEIRNLVRHMCNLVIEKLPFLEPYLQPKCARLGYCPESEKRTCGLRKLRKDVIGG